MDEYEQIQRLRELWSRAIMTWGQVFLPLGAATIAFFVTQSRSAAGWDFQLLLIGWLVFSACMIYWRWVVHNIDEQIVGMYPAMLRLDKGRKSETQTEYYFNNLHSRSLSFLRQKLSLKGKIGTYEKFKEVARTKGKDHYELLLAVWNKYQRNSVKSRGHKVQDAIILLIMVSFLITVLWLKFNCWALFAILLYLFILPWGTHRGWWSVKHDSSENADLSDA